MYLMVATPHGRDLEPEYVGSLVNLVIQSPCKISVHFREGILIHRNRNMLFEAAQKSDCDALLFIDSDMTFTPNDVKAMLDSPYDVTTGLCMNRWHHGFPVLCKWDDTSTTGYTFYTLDEIGTEPRKVDLTGAAFLMIKRPVLDMWNGREDRPFSLVNDRDGEDYAFCVRLKEMGVPIYVLPHVKLGHVGTVIHEVP